MFAKTEIGTGLRRGAVSASLLLLAVVMSACSGNGATQAPPSTPTGPVPPADPAAFCTAAVDFMRVVSDGPDIDDPPGPPEAVATAFEEYEARLEPPLKDVEQSARPAAQQDIATIVRQTRYAVATRDEAAIQTPEYNAALDRLGAFMISECGFEEVRVTALDHRYEGLPPALPAGTVAFTLSNQGAEPHDLDVYRIHDGVSQPFQQLAQLPDEQMDFVLTAVEEITSSPGNAETEFLTLIPGRYGVECPVPLGSTATADGTGPPHYELGQIAEFTVG
jgi:hypothetical protein